MTALAPYLSAFLLEHLPRERKASPHTSDAYAHSFKLLVCFAAARLRVKPFQIEIEQLVCGLTPRRVGRYSRKNCSMVMPRPFGRCALMRPLP